MAFEDSMTGRALLDAEDDSGSNELRMDGSMWSEAGKKKERQAGPANAINPTIQGQNAVKQNSALTDINRTKMTPGPHSKSTSRFT